jgi:hypothetical protein
VVNDSVCRVRAGVKVLGASRVVVQRRGSAVVCSASPVSTIKLAVQGMSRNVVEVLEERWLIEFVTSEELRTACTKQRLKVYCGFDPTAESLHLGNLLGIIVVFPILVLAGGAIEFQYEQWGVVGVAALDFDGIKGVAWDGVDEPGVDEITVFKSYRK